MGRFLGSPNLGARPLGGDISESPSSPDSPNVWERLYRLRPRIRRIRSRLRSAFVIALLVLADPSPRSLAWGGGFILLGAVLHFVSSGYLAKEEVLTTRGPYRWVRNPFYLANVAIDVGLALAAWNWIVPAVYLSLIYLLVVPSRVIGHEEPTLRRIFGAEYLEYCRLVPRFVPHPFVRPARASGAFAWRNLLENREVSRFLNTMLLVALFFFAWRLRSNGWKPLHVLREPLVAVVASVGAGLYAISIAFYLKKRASRIARGQPPSP